MTPSTTDKSHRFLPLGLGPRGLLPNLYDVVIFILIAGGLVLLAHGAHEMGAPLATLDVAPVTLDPANLPEYALRTTLRMFAAIFASLVFTFVVATLAAKSRKAELVIVPALDILQSVPVLGFLTFTVVFFMGLFPGSQLGAECAAIFAIFTSQAWNMAFSFYQSLRTVPHDLDEASRHFRLSPWLRFWRLEVPFAAPGLIWNTMMSMSGGWFFVVASEAITVGETTLKLPGIGSWLAVAIQQEDIGAVGLAVATMAVVILAYDQLVFRPIVAWADKFRFEQTAAQQRPQSWVFDLVRRGRLIGWLFAPLVWLGALSLRIRFARPSRRGASPQAPGRVADIVWIAIVLAGAGYALWLVIDYLGTNLGMDDAVHAFGLGFLTLTRVVVLIAIASLIWVPIGVWIGLRPAVAERVQPVAHPGRISGQCAVSGCRGRNRVAQARSQHLAEPADGARHAVVHPVQRHCRCERLPDRSARGFHPVPAALVAMVATGDPARDLSVLRDRGLDGLRRLLEREHRGGSRKLGRYQAYGGGPRLIYRAGDGSGRLSPRGARDRGDVDLRRHDQPAALAAALSAGRATLPPGLKRKPCHGHRG